LVDRLTKWLAPRNRLVRARCSRRHDRTSHTMRIMSDIRAANAEAAATIIDSVFLHTPHLEDASLSQAVGRDVVVKPETINPVRSFKGRGASYFMEQVTPGQRVVTASAG